ncbi:hypothetical protein M426DRAFT_21859 [Hypoxylon sp. CI-4A]|nr:hypothetical protein M426DRAFT_21859 [Hypoxylon sp. CI-4A]
MFALWGFPTPHRHGESSKHRKPIRKHHGSTHDSTTTKRRIDLLDLDYDVTKRMFVNTSIKETSRLDHLECILKKRYLDGSQRIPEDAKIQFYLFDKPLDGGDIPQEAPSLNYRVLESEDDGAIRVLWQGTDLKLRKPQIEVITREVASGKSVGAIRETAANLLRSSNKSREQQIQNASQIVVEAMGGLRPGPIQGNNWEARQVQTQWLCRYLLIYVRPPNDYLVLRGFNEQYVWHKPYRDSRGCADVRRTKAWLKKEVLTTAQWRKAHRRSINIDDIRFIYRGKQVNKHTHIRPGEIIDFELPRTAEDNFILAEAALVPLTETCVVCSDEKRVSEMPNRLRITASCEHDSSMCKECVASWITSSMDTVTWDRLKCPECPQLLKYDNVRAFATKEIFERYDTLAVKALLSGIPEFMWCLNPHCDSGQIYPTGCERAKCYACKHYICVRHNVPWHKGETCDEYERRTRRQRRSDMASEKHVKEITKACPGCNRNVHKYEGCDHVTCICGHEWCWLCFGKYYRDKDEFLQCHHTEECRYHTNPPNYEGGRAFMPFLDFVPPPAAPMPGGAPRDRRPPPAGPGNHHPRRFPIRDPALAQFVMRRHEDRNPFNPHANINPAQHRQRLDFFEEAMLFNLDNLAQRAERGR